MEVGREGKKITAVPVYCFYFFVYFCRFCVPVETSLKRGESMKEEEGQTVVIRGVPPSFCRACVLCCVWSCVSVCAKQITEYVRSEFLMMTS